MGHDIILYDENGYLNMKSIIEQGYTFTILIVGRGTGKTYGTLKYMIDNSVPFLYMRRTESQKNELSTPALNVFNSINDDTGRNIYPHKITKTIFGYYESETDNDGNIRPVGNCLGMLAALSTLSNKRGFDGSHIRCMILDEFCPEDHERALKNESNAIFNCYETINRNRELRGDKPLQLIMLANSNSIQSQTLLKFGLVKIITNMRKRGTQIYKNEQKSMLVICPSITPIGKQKQNTALYKLLGDESDYTKMAISNMFTDVIFSNVNSKPIKEYRSIVSIGDICIYKHKSRQIFYVSKHTSGTPVHYSETKTDIYKFRRIYYPVFDAYINERVFFEDEECQIKFINIFQK